MSRFSLRTLRQICFFGLSTVLWVDLMQSLRLPDGFSFGIGILSTFLLAAPVVSLLLMPKAVAAIVRNKDFLIPLALATIAGRAVAWLSTTPALQNWLSPSLPVQVLRLSFNLSLYFLISLALAVAYAAWMTATVVEFVCRGQVDPRNAFLPAMRRFWRFFALEFLGWGALMGATVPLLSIPSLSLGIIALLPLALIWNFSTAAVLPVAWEEPGGWWKSFCRGVRVSLGNLPQWWLLLLAQMLLLGLVSFYYTYSDENTSSGWNINAFWIGGYANESKWYELADALHRPRLPFVKTILDLMLGTVAVAVKIAIVQRSRFCAVPEFGQSAGATDSPNTAPVLPGGQMPF
ncbi:MAG TPA: hypothetical protein VFY29_21145 [Terriglobia bacterium]|nr:hypothetical protein [Terriglobia bacterium]